MSGQEQSTTVYAGARGFGTSLRDASMISSHDDSFVLIDGEKCFRITNTHELPEFFMTLVSSSDHWMFISSWGALTAGRRNADSALFPYYCSDKISDLRHCTGPHTVFHVRRLNHEQTPSRGQLWHPFANSLINRSGTRQNVYKNEFGNKVWFEEIHDELGLSFRYRWTFGSRFGFVRDVELQNIGNHSAQVRLLDGLLNVLPSRLDQNFQLRFSNLADAYKKSELLINEQIGLFYLNSIPTDRSEPSEGLRATAVWQYGLPAPKVLLSDRQIGLFAKGSEVVQEKTVCGQRGAFLVASKLTLAPGASHRWRMTACLNQDQTDIVNLRQLCHAPQSLNHLVDEDIEQCEEKLLAISSAADGRQLGRKYRPIQRHQSNAIFNVMRGGLPESDYLVRRNDFLRHVRNCNVSVFGKHRDKLELLPDHLSIDRLLAVVRESCDIDLQRLAMEYLPLTFSRRHGDPTRPWNVFDIKLVDEAGDPDLNYQGNWRDIFQNWEAMAMSWPKLLPGMVFRFLNASTADGYNPYRLTKSGFEWEEPDPNDPWSNIGYWGDHQIVYLLKLLEATRRYEPERLDHWMNVLCCTYAQIPYRLKGFDAIRDNPRETIFYDGELATSIQERVHACGADGKLLYDSSDQLCRATLAEKLLVPALAKLTNYVPDGGIWMNTQRPEWNDANNALAGYGLSVVTVCYLRRYFAFLLDWFSQLSATEFSVSEDIVNLLREIDNILGSNLTLVGRLATDGERTCVLESLGRAGERYRNRLYGNKFTGDKVTLTRDVLCEFFKVCIQHLDQTISNNHRSDGLYNAYNLLQYDLQSGRNEFYLKQLYPMLEGQVAVLSSGCLSPFETVSLLDALRSSDLYREDQNSYMLQPDRDTLSFLERNHLTIEKVASSELIRNLLADKNESIIRQDILGQLHFNGDLRNSEDLRHALERLAQEPNYRRLVAHEGRWISQVFEDLFQHQLFTGRSISFFGYEGLGSIYWHMVSKLLLAVQERLMTAIEESADRDIVSRLHHHYRAIRDGLGTEKSPEQYGAFPTDPYSHTPAQGGVQQPGMTGQVKEDLLCRFQELGVCVRRGVVSFEPYLLERDELLSQPSRLIFTNINGDVVSETVPEKGFAFTLCQVPVVYRTGDHSQLRVYFANGSCIDRPANSLSAAESSDLFHRSGAVRRIEFQVGPEWTI